MNETPTYAQFSFHNGEDVGFGMFDVPGVTIHSGLHPSIPPAAYANAFPLHTPPASSGHHHHIQSQNTPFAFLPRSLVASYHEQTGSSTPYPAPAPPKFDSPSLSSGSSSTPETRESQQLVTPKHASTLTQAPDDHDVIGEEEEEDFDDLPLPLPTSGRRKLGGRHKAKEGGDQYQQYPDEHDGKRRHFLQRNRVAAMKCRKKKKEWVNDLEETKTELESQNAHLHMELDGLVDEASRIRAQLMVHANCNDSNINKWIENEAKRFVIGTSERYDQILQAHFSPTQDLTTNSNNRQDSGAGLSSSSGGVSVSEYNTAGGAILISPLATPSQLPPTPHPAQIPSSPAFYAPSASMNTPGCYTVPSQETTPFGHGLDRTPTADEEPDFEPDYDGMSISLYDHSFG
ncbi:hypothetical protein HD806DRAFT_145970 [Xylariaceae sp. AK1471]|nr:hypothetical protein HD806DRAFT_145970 [Xylariaceae sp. AK1471]